LNDVVTSKTSVLATGAISKLPDVVQLCKQTILQWLKEYLFFHDFNFKCFSFFVYSLTMPKFILKNNVALINGKKDEVIYGHVMCTAGPPY
jgi:hypothetical protein